LPEVLQHGAANAGTRQPQVSPASTTLPFNKQSYFPGELAAASVEVLVVLVVVVAAVDVVAIVSVFSPGFSF